MRNYAGDSKAWLFQHHMKFLGNDACAPERLSGAREGRRDIDHDCRPATGEELMVDGRVGDCWLWREVKSQGKVGGQYRVPMWAN